MPFSFPYSTTLVTLGEERLGQIFLCANKTSGKTKQGFIKYTCKEYVGNNNFVTDIWLYEDNQLFTLYGIFYMPSMCIAQWPNRPNFHVSPQVKFNWDIAEHWKSWINPWCLHGKMLHCAWFPPSDKTRAAWMELVWGGAKRGWVKKYILVY